MLFHVDFIPKVETEDSTKEKEGIASPNKAIDHIENSAL
jgi:hypothetical protein